MAPALVSRKEVTSRGQGGQAPCDVGQQGEVWQTLNMGLQFLADLGYPSKLLFIFLRKQREDNAVSLCALVAKFKDLILNTLTLFSYVLPTRLPLPYSTKRQCYVFKLCKTLYKKGKHNSILTTA